MSLRASQSAGQEQANRKRSRISLDMSPELRRRVKVEAAKRDITVRAYLEEIIERAVQTDERVGAVTGASPIESLRRLRTELDAKYPGQREDDSTELLRETREERSRHMDRL
jgi:hypothetical protein